MQATAAPQPNSHPLQWDASVEKRMQKAFAFLFGLIWYFHAHICKRTIHRECQSEKKILNVGKAAENSFMTSIHETPCWFLVLWILSGEFTTENFLCIFHLFLRYVTFGASCCVLSWVTKEIHKNVHKKSHLCCKMWGWNDGWLCFWSSWMVN